MSKDIKVRVPKTISYRASSSFGRVLVDLSGLHPEKFAGEAAYTMLIKDDHSRMGLIFFLKTKKLETCRMLKPVALSFALSSSLCSGES